MRDDRMEIAPASSLDRIVTYSRIENRKPGASREGAAPLLVGVEVPDVHAPDLDDPLGTAPTVHAPADGGARSQGRRLSVGLFSAVALAAIAAGVGVLAGSFAFPIVGKVEAPVIAPEKAEVAASPEPRRDRSMSEAPVAPPVVRSDSAAGQDSMVSMLPIGSDATGPAGTSEATSAAPTSQHTVGKTTGPVAPPPVAPPIPRARPEHKATPEVATPPPAAVDQGAAVVEAAPSSPQIEESEPLSPPTSILPDGGAFEETPVPPAEIPGQPDFAAVQPAPAGENWSPAGEAPAAGDRNAPYRSALDQWTVLGVHDGRAIVDGRERGVFMVEPGSEIPGVGIVEAIERRGGRWAVVTSIGTIVSSIEDNQRPFQNFLARK